MKKTLLRTLPFAVPHELEPFVSGAQVYDSSCSPEARVYFLDKDGGYYLKAAKKGDLQKEAQMTAYFHALGLGAEVLDYTSGERDWLLTAKLPGEDCLCEEYISNPERLCDTIAQQLRKLHELDYTGCPVTDRTAEYISTVEANYRKGICDLQLFSGCYEFASPQEAKRIFDSGKSALKRDALLHGDYCLPNIMLNRWKPSGFIDLGCGGVGDRHIDLFWGTWTLWFNLKTTRYKQRFLDAYGRDKVEEEMLEIIAAAEVFG